MKNIFNILLITFLSVQFIACSDDDPIKTDPKDDLYMQTYVSVPDTDLTIKLYTEAENGFTTGYNAFFLGAFDTDDNLVADLAIVSTPIMTMMDKTHSAPHEIMSISSEIGGGMQEYSTVFVMPTSEMGAWTLMVKYTYEDAVYETTIPVTVMNPITSKMASISIPDGQPLFVSLVLPTEPTVGSNDFEITINKKVTMMDWPGMENYSVAIDPEMPAMGHGSPNNVDPTHTANGHYAGTVNFTMTGEWLINITISEDGAVIAETGLTIIL